MKETDMEHIEKIIRDKIRETEQVPADWNREWVWTRIETPGIRKKTWLLYTAASLVIMMVSVSVYWKSSTYEKTMMMNLDRIESQIDQLHRVPLQEVIDEKCNQEVVAEQHFAHALKNKKPLLKVTSIPDTDFTESISPDPEITILDEESIAQAEVPTQFLAIKNERQIKPIVGKIPPATPAANSTRRAAEIRITVFESPDLKDYTLAESRAYKIINTRINTP